MSGKKVCGRPLRKFLEEVEKFHGWKAPGILIGGFMVDWGLELLGGGVEFDAIVEPDLRPEISRIMSHSGKGLRW